MATTAHREVAQAVANYDYAGRSDRELSFKKGQRISVFQRQESGWWVGEVEGKRGLFPGSFVQEVPVVVEATTSKPGASGSGTSWSGSFSGSEVSTTASRGNQSSPPSAQRAPPAHATWSKGTRGVPPISTATAVGAASTSSSASVPATSPRTTVSTAYRRRGYTADILACGKVVALFDFTGDNDKKISFKRGDTINVLQKLQEEGWWEGELNGQVGLFPSNYVRLVEMNTTPAPIVSNPPAAHSAAHSAAATAAKPQVAHAEAGTAPLMVVCLYDFKTDDTSKLSLKKGDEVEVVKKASESWWKGRMGKKIGYFPSSYVKAIEPTATTAPASASVAAPASVAPDATGPAAQTAAHQLQRAASHGPIPNRAAPPPPSRATRQTLPIEDDNASAVTASQTWLVALYHYAARNDDELSFTKGDRVKLVEDLSVNWYRGELHGKVGRVPKNYVHLEASAISTATAAIGLEQVVANNNPHHHGSHVSHGAPAVADSFYSQTNDLFLQYNEAEEELERVAKAEAERVEAERLRVEKEQEEQERARALEAVRERAAREAQEKEERERLEKEAWDKAERERVEQEARERAERERIEKEAQEKEECERRKREAAEKAERERAEKEARKKEERERREKEERERQQLTADDPRAKERERRAREEEDMRLRESEYAAQQEQRRREPPPVASRGGRSANLNRSLPAPPTVAGGSGIIHQPRAAPVPTLIPSTIPPLRKVSVGTTGEAAATATPGAGSSLPPPLVYSRPIAGSSGATLAAGAYAQRASSVPVMTNIPRRPVPATPVTVVTGVEAHQELRQEVEALRQAAATTAGDEDESQLATTFEQLRRLVLDERRERRQMADRLTAVEERLAKLGV